ncbi:MAG: serine/threonine protein kinase [Gammaproteobacteria bacterium]|nr:serine/threonine protein kinase [Gammaproteobacteria bacterium]MBU6510147.1 serine/threonine protein kinase [Gammaproteobacteria bacterium]MDE1983902.1 serine/threonine protein kinase [Gammaproteobacteria bacterium]MDE2108265.1 serine/threonine protein kinase [Gammaproteobacteria bacterium]MDE2460665.1 serine/threonine protein kinase [Gammaproteobacteria bacterium]
MNDTPAATPYANLTPEVILAAVEATGRLTDGTLLALNSYENRVYQVGIEGERPLIVKFYRPGRWSNAAILEEHAFTRELAEREIPVVAPLADAQGVTLLQHAGYRYALFPRQGGRAPDLERPQQLEWLGRFIGRIHSVGALRKFEHRASISPDTFGHEPQQFLLQSGFLPSELAPRYREVTDLLLAGVERCFARAGAVRNIRLHGDCHPGNLLWTDAGPHFVDFDDCVTGPAIQDLWMLLSGSRAEMEQQFGHVIEGYRGFADFNAAELNLVEALRTLRMLHYAAWIARRWDDPAFPRAFPWFNAPRYWEEHIQSLREQLPLLDEAPLSLD